MARPEHLAILEPYLAAIDAHDEAVLREMRTETYTELFPQSSEAIRGRDAVAAVERTSPAPPSFSRPTHVTSIGEDAIVVESLASYGGSPWWVVARMDLDDGQVAREVAYFGEPFEPPAYRSAWVERYDAAVEAGDLSEPTASDAMDREDIDRLARVFELGRMADLGAFFHPDWVGDYPQSGERFADLRALRLAHEPYPGGLPIERVIEVSGPADRMEMTPFVPIRIHGSGACWMLEIENEYPDGSRFFQVVITRALAGRIRWTRWYWCPPFEAPAWRAPYTERSGPID